MEKDFKNSALSDTLESLTSGDSLKADVSVKIKPTAYPLIGLTIIIAVTASIILAHYIEKVISK
jgi:hypothetical protein